MKTLITSVAIFITVVSNAQTFNSVTQSYEFYISKRIYKKHLICEIKHDVDSVYLCQPKILKRHQYYELEKDSTMDFKIGDYIAIKMGRPYSETIIYSRDCDNHFRNSDYKAYIRFIDNSRW